MKDDTPKADVAETPAPVPERIAQLLRGISIAHENAELMALLTKEEAS